MGTATIGGRIVLEGEREYSKALREISANQKELRSEMKYASAAFADSQNSTEALTKKYDILTRQVEEQRKKVEVYTSAIEKTTQQQGKAEEKIAQYSGELEEAERKLQEMSSASDTSSEALEEQRKAVEQANDKLTMAQQEYDKTTNKISGYRTSLNNTQADLVTMERELEQTSGYLEEARNSTDGCASSIDRYGRNVREARDETEDFEQNAGEAFNALATGIAAAGIAEGVKKIADALMECTEKAKEFETAMAQVYTIADSTVVPVAEMKQEIMDFSNQLGTASSSIAAAAYSAISAGVETENAVGFAAEATKLAIGGFTDAETAVDILTTTLNAYGLETSEAEKVSSMLVTTQNLGKTTVAELASNMGKVIPTAAAYKMQLNNLSTAYALATARGIATAEATTYINSMLNELGDAGSTVAGILAEQTGKSFGMLMEEGVNLGEVIGMLGESVEGNQEEFMGLWASAEAGKVAVSLLQGGMEEFDNVLEQMENSSGAAEKAFEKMSDTTEMTEKKFLTSAENLKIAIGEELNPMLQKLYEAGTEAFQWAREIVEENPQLVTAITALVTGITVFTVGITAAAAATAACTAAMTALKAVVNPASLLVTGVIAFAAAIGVAVANTKDINKENEEFINISKEQAEAVHEKMEASKEELENITAMKEEVLRLNDQQNLDVEGKQRLVTLVGSLNQAMPELNLQIDKQTGKLLDNTLAWEETLDVLLKKKEIEANQERVNELLDIYMDLNSQLPDLIKQAEEAETAKDKAVTEFSERRTHYGEVQARVAEEDAAKAKENVEAVKIQMEDLETEYTDLQNKTNEYTKEIENQTLAVDENGQVQVDYLGQIHKVTPEVKRTVDELTQAYSDNLISAEASLETQVGLFQELKIESDVSVKKMAENLGSQTDTYNQYKDDLIKANELLKGDNSDLLQSIMDMGINGAGYLRELVSAYEQGSDEFNKVLEEWSKMQEAKDNLSEAMADIKTNYSEQMAELLGIHQDKNEEMQKETEKASKDFVSTVEDGFEEVVKNTKDSIADMQKAVTENTPEVVGAAKELCSQVEEGTKVAMGIQDGSSSVFEEIGGSIPQGMADGIIKNGSVVREAIEEILSNAVGTMDLSGFVDKINRALGEALE